MNKAAFETKKMVVGIDPASTEGDFSAAVLAEIRDDMVRVIDRMVCDAWGVTPPTDHMDKWDVWDATFAKTVVDLSPDEYKVQPIAKIEGNVDAENSPPNLS